MKRRRKEEKAAMKAAQMKAMGDCNNSSSFSSESSNSECGEIAEENELQMQGLEQQVNSCQAADAGAPFPSRGAPLLRQLMSTTSPQSLLLDSEEELDELLQSPMAFICAAFIAAFSSFLLLFISFFSALSTCSCASRAFAASCLLRMTRISLTKNSL
ncbi:hypothetical protein MRB53_030455 [Persea americana]|uniref:Uncharacterized protein n=1 Tax=Persea americana TaxID=3435 RepID=A0ACC2KLA6_PERAE|nr:hypothetical protein MRB53_030455 [Persea americana]